VTWTNDLARAIAGQVLSDESARASVATDFGRVITRTPLAVVRPACTEDVARVLKFASSRSLAVSTRGAGHSQAGQSLSEHLVLDMTSLDQIRDVDEAALTVVCQGGVTWRALVGHLAGPRLSPPVLTNNLDATVGGTLSSAGLGVASWRYGTQADNCVELEVVTGGGERVRCSRQTHREVFDAVRAGMGQFGVITEARLKLRHHHPGFRSFYLLYDDLAALVDDCQLLMNEERFDYLEAWCAPCPQGFKSVGAERQAFAQWFYPLHATIEADWPSPLVAAPEKLQGLRFYKHVHTEGGDIQDFFRRLDALFALWKRGGFWDYAHPWMECVLPWQSTPFYITQVLHNMPPQAVAGGHILLWPARGNASTVPLFMRPAGEYLMGFGILPAIPRQFVGEALPKLRQASQAAMMVGGKRYLSGWVQFEPTQWKAHYGDLWPSVVVLKTKYDPKGILNPHFLKTE
jgi:FAD/FMN-containing dehydrogenase